jgi:hypothetical protein
MLCPLMIKGQRINDKNITTLLWANSTCDISSKNMLYFAKEDSHDRGITFRTY